MIFVRNALHFAKPRHNCIRTLHILSHLKKDFSKFFCSFPNVGRNGTSVKSSIQSKINPTAVIYGKLRVLNRYYAYVQHPIDKTPIAILGKCREKALDGDIVSVTLFPIGSWKVRGTNRNVVVSLVEPKPEDNEEIVSAEEDSLEVESEDTSLDSSTTPDPDPIKRPFKHFSDIYSLKSVYQLSTVTDADCWPSELPKDVKLDDYSYSFRPLPSRKLIRTGKVHGILIPNMSSRRFLGQISFRAPNGTRKDSDSISPSPELDTSKPVCFFLPSSRNNPYIILDADKLPAHVKENHDLGLNSQYICTVTGWDAASGMPQGFVSGELGDINQLEDATKALLMNHGIADEEFTAEQLAGLPQSPESFVIPRSEYGKRQDFRSCCIMSIDPVSAKDVDDALHVKQLQPDLFEVGVHIADVSYFVRPGSSLDQEASRRATSVYLVQKVIPMLPPILSDHLCSLNPCTDKLAFSVVMRVRPNGDIVSTWLGRSIIRSRIKLSYEHAAAILKQPAGQTLADSIPKPEPPFTMEHVRDSLLMLNNIARNLRARRIENGALTLQKSKIEFDLPTTKFDPDPEDTADSVASTQNVWPIGFSIQSSGPSHQLIEEFMLLTNQVVAQRLFQAFCHTHTMDQRGVKGWLGALLRNHEAPPKKRLDDLTNLLKSGGIELPDGRSKTIASTLKQHNEKLKASGYSDAEREAIMSSLSHLVYVRMNMATYFSLDELLRLHAELQNDVGNDSTRLFEHTWHYGLNVPLYTHFTSPIRRYADLMVHRQLAAILEASELGPKFHVINPSRSRVRTRTILKYLGVQAEWCNSKRIMARRAQEASQRLFLTACIRDCGPITMNVTVTDLSRTTIKVLLPEIGVVLTTPLDDFFQQAKQWNYIPPVRSSNGSGDGNGETSDAPRTSSYLLVRWKDSPSDEDDSSPIIRKEIRILSVLPCSVFSLKDQLALGVRFLPSNPDATGVVSISTC